MAGSSRRTAGERVLESRHLVGLFLGVVLLCGVFFTLGYVMGKTQYGTPVQAATEDRDPAPPSKRDADRAEPKTENVPPATPQWDFYPSDKANDRLEAPDPTPAAVKPESEVPAVAHQGDSAASRRDVSANASKSLGHLQPPWVPKGSVVLQLAALTREGDALALADALQQKGFPSFVTAPSKDNFFRVQVGPYKNMPQAQKARQSLQQEGFKAIVKR